jgi:hypothetical protein
MKSAQLHGGLFDHGTHATGLRSAFDKKERLSAVDARLERPVTMGRTARAADLGLNPLALRFLILTTCLTGVTLIGYPLAGLSMDVGTVWSIRAFVVGLSLLLWAYYFIEPGRQRKDWLMAEMVFAFLLVYFLTLVLAPAQYLAAAAGCPTIDPLLATADRWMGVYVPALVEWSRAHPTINAILIRAYSTLLAQFTLTFVVLGVILRDRDALWEYTFNFYFCATVTVLASAVFPAAGAFVYYDFTSTIDQTRFITHFEGIRSGVMRVVSLGDMEGMISMPSFHVAGALLLTWALRRCWWLLMPVGLINIALIAATVLTGAHYAIDGIAALLLTAASIMAYRRWGAPLLYKNASEKSVSVGNGPSQSPVRLLPNVL